jgi:hypothetical protein
MNTDSLKRSFPCPSVFIPLHPWLNSSLGCGFAALGLSMFIRGEDLIGKPNRQGTRTFRRRASTAPVEGEAIVWTPPAPGWSVKSGEADHEPEAPLVAASIV